MGPGLLRTAAAVGLTEIGEIASLSESAALSLFGKRGPLLRNMAQGIDGSRVDGKGERRITRQADFAEDVIEETAVVGALEALAETGGLEMRRDKLGASCVRLAVVYADGVRIEGTEKGSGTLAPRLFVLDRDIAGAGRRIYRKAATRRVRIRSIGLALEGLMPLGYEADLFETEEDVKGRKLQAAVEAIQNRYGAGAVCRAVRLGMRSVKTASMPFLQK